MIKLGRAIGSGEQDVVAVDLRIGKQRTGGIGYLDEIGEIAQIGICQGRQYRDLLPLRPA